MTASSPLKRYLSRREFLAELGASALAGTAGTLLAPTPASSAVPRRGGVLRIGWYASTANDTLNPVRLTQSYDIVATLLIMSTLVRLDEKMILRPDLAISWDSPDGKVWTFHLRPGVQFHDGKSLHARDVVYSFNRHRGKDSESAIRSWFDGVADIEAVDASTVRITLKAADVDFPRLLAWPATVVVPDGFTNFSHPVGTGPFRLKGFEPGIGIRATRFENYYFEGRPYVDEVEIVGITDASARMNALLSGDVEYISGVDPKVVQLIRRADGVELATGPGSQHFTFPMRTRFAPYSNNDVRQGLRYLADRKGMVDNVFQGLAVLGNDHPIPPSDPYFSPDIPQRPYDPERARWLFRKANFNAEPLLLHTSDAAGGAVAFDMALLYKESAAKGSLTLNVKRDPADSYYSSVWNKQPFTMCNWVPRPSANLLLSQVYLSGAKWNESQFHNDRFDKLVIGVRSVVDEKVRREMYHDIQKILYDEGASIIPLFANSIDARSKALMGWTAHPFGPASGYRLAENAWINS